MVSQIPDIQALPFSVLLRIPVLLRPCLLPFTASKVKGKLKPDNEDIYFLFLSPLIFKVRLFVSTLYFYT